jgi:hypothetical protein
LGSYPDRDKRFLSCTKRPGRLGDPTSHLFIGHRGSFPAVKRLGHEVNHSSPSNDEVKQEWSYTSSPPIRLHGVDRENFTFVSITVVVVVVDSSNN